MGHWGVRSYEVDEAHDALDAGFAFACGAEYERLMDDRCPLTLEQVQERLASPAVLEAALAAHADGAGTADEACWDEVQRLAYAGIVVRFVELKVPIPEEVRERARRYLEEESLEWDAATKRRLRRERELGLLEQAEVTGTGRAGGA
jgi:hypothetical protein